MDSGRTDEHPYQLSEYSKIAKEQNLQVKPQRNGRLVVFGQPEDILKSFLKKMTAEATKQ